jgi:hypothetical protein
MIQQGEWFTLSGVIVFITLLIIGFVLYNKKGEKKEKTVQTAEGENPVFVSSLTLGYNTVTAAITAAVIEHIRNTSQTDIMAAITAAVIKYRNSSK